MAFRRRGTRARPRKSNLTGQLTDPVSKWIPTKEDDFAPLPWSIDGCTQELEMLTDRQRSIATRVERVTSQLDMLVARRRGGSKLPRKSEPIIRRISLEEQSSSVEADDPNWGDGKETPAKSPEKEEDTPLAHRSSASYDDETVDDQSSSPLICALKKLQKRDGRKRSIWSWTYNLANLFKNADSDRSGFIESREYTEMIDKLDLSPNLKSVLRGKFSSIDIDGSGAICLEEFLKFFLQFPMFKRELMVNVSSNAPFAYENSLSSMQQWRQWVYCVVECPGYNRLSKTLFCFDVVLTLVPVFILCIEGLRPSVTINWYRNRFMWIASIFFMLEYISGLITCKFKREFILNIGHIFELVSFLFWIIYNTFGHAGTLDPMGFIVFRVVRLIELHMVFKLETMKEDIDIYVQTLSLAYTSYGAVSMLLSVTIVFFSLIIYVFERGEFNEIEKMWERDDGSESPFSDLWNCVYFVVVTMTTLGYGDISPKSYVGKLVAMMTVLVGLCNITFLINIVGDCFEEVFRSFVVKRSEKMELDHSKFLHECVERTATSYEVQKSSSNRFWRQSNENRLLRNKRVLASANDEYNNC